MKNDQFRFGHVVDDDDDDDNNVDDDDDGAASTNQLTNSMCVCIEHDAVNNKFEII